MTAEKRAALRAQYPLMNFPNAASCLTTTAEDYARFLLGMSDKEILVPRVPAGQGLQWGLGFGLIENRTRGTGLWHWGDFGVFQNFAVVFPATGEAVVSLTNGARGQRFNRQISRALLGEELACFSWLRV